MRKISAHLVRLETSERALIEVATGVSLDHEVTSAELHGLCESVCTHWGARSPKVSKAMLELVEFFACKADQVLAGPGLQ